MATCSCGATVTSAFCGSCGNPAPASAVAVVSLVACASCGHQRSASENFCGNCGSAAVAVAPTNFAAAQPVMATVIGMKGQVSTPGQMGGAEIPMASTTPLVDDMSSRPGAIVLFNGFYAPIVAVMAFGIFLLIFLRRVFFWYTWENWQDWNRQQRETFDWLETTGSDLLGVLRWVYVVHLILTVAVFRKEMLKSMVLWVEAMSLVFLIVYYEEEFQHIFRWPPFIVSGGLFSLAFVRAVRLLRAPMQDRVRIWA